MKYSENTCPLLKKSAVSTGENQSQLSAKGQLRRFSILPAPINKSFCKGESSKVQKPADKRIRAIK